MEYFKEMEGLSEPRSTRVTQHVTGCSIRDRDNGIMYLPNYLSKRGMYVRFCTERGWTLEYQEKDDYKATEQSEGPLPICSWYKFCCFWKEKYPKLRLGFATEGVCTMCQVFHNKIKHKLKEKEVADRRASAALSDSDNRDTTNDSNDDIINGSGNEPPGVLLEVNTACAIEEKGHLEECIGQFSDLVEDVRLKHYSDSSLL